MTQVRHILGLSGGKDSTALAVLLHQEIPDMEYFFCDTHKELPETYNYLDRIKARLGIHIHYLSPNRGFDHWLDLHGGMLPSPQMRWCTVMMKIKPLEQFTRRMKRLATLAFGQMKTEESFKKTIVYIFNGSLNILTTSLKL